MDDTKELAGKIKKARAYAEQVFRGRANLAAALSGAVFVIDHKFEFPELDTMRVYQCMFGRRVGEPTTYRLSFGRQLKWVGVPHPQGVKPADIVVEEAT